MVPGFWQLILVLAVVLLVFGTKRLKDAGGDLGGAIKGFKKAMSDEESAAQKLSEDESVSKVDEKEDS